jgi:hypothetical protein
MYSTAGYLGPLAAFSFSFLSVNCPEEASVYGLIETTSFLHFEGNCLLIQVSKHQDYCPGTYGIKF